jgi:hypothetical protein
MNCSKCFYQTDRSAAWSFAFAQKIVHDAARLRVTWLAVGGGEPTEWPHLIKFIKYAKSYNLRVAVTTNGTKLLPIDADLVHISHDSIHAERDGWKERQRVVRKAIAYYKKRGIAVGINTLPEDVQRIGSATLKQLTGGLTLVLPKPITLLPRWRSEIYTAAGCASKFTTVAFDSCLAVLYAHHMCFQSRTSMSIDAAKHVRICSNINQSKITYTTLESAWRKIKATAFSAPPGCLVDNTRRLSC